MILVKIIPIKLFLYLYILVFLSSCINDSETVINGSTMGTTYTVKVNNHLVDTKYLKTQLDSVLFNINNTLSTYVKNSEINKINKSRLNDYNVSEEFSFVLRKSLFYANLSDGYYDPTVYPFVDAWGFGPSDISKRPDDKVIKEIKNNVSYKFLNIRDNILSKSNVFTYIDLSSIAKGYAVDFLCDYLLNIGYYDIMVDIGGELRCHSRSSDNSRIIGVANPYDSKIYLKTKINNHSIATSGNYNNFTMYDGVEYSHIINPKTGYPVKNQILSCTVISEKCIDADALATMLMVLPIENGLSIIDNVDNTECLILSKGERGISEFMSSGFKRFIVD